MRNKILILLGILTFSCSIFGQYTENKLPSGLTESTTVGDNDYTIIQKNGESIVKAVRMDTTASYIKQYIVDGISIGDGNLMITDGVNILKTSDISYDNTTYGGVLTIGTGVNASYSAYNLNISAPTQPNTQGGAYSLTVGADNTNQGTSCLVVGQSNTMPTLDGFNISSAIGVSNYINATQTHAKGTGLYTNSYRETVIGSYNDSVTGADFDSWVATDRLFTIGNGSNGAGLNSNALVMLKNGNTTATGDWVIDGDLEVTGEFSGQTPMIACAAFQDESETLSMTEDVWATVTNATNDIFTDKGTEGFTLSNDTLIATADAQYATLFWAISMNVTDNDTYKGRIYKNNTEQIGCAEIDGDINTAFFCSMCITEIEEGDYFVLQVVNTDDNGDATVICGRMVITKEF